MIILVGLDEHESALRALRRGLELGASLGADVHVLHAVHLPAPALSLVAEAPIDLQRFMREAAAPVWELAAPIIADATVAVTEVTKRGYPPDELLDYAEDVEASMIVLGSRGRSELAAFFLGSTGHRVLHFAKCDVHIVKEHSP